MPIGLIRPISTQKGLKTCINKGDKENYLGSNQQLEHFALFRSVFTHPKLESYTVAFFRFLTL